MKTGALCTLFLLASSLGSMAEVPPGLYFGQAPPGPEPTIFAPGLVSMPGRRNAKIAFSPDGHECLIGIGEAGRFKLLYSTYDNGKWAAPMPAYFVNTAFAIEPFFSPDGQKVFFVGYNNNFHDADIYISTRVEHTWTTPVKLPAPVNSNAEEYHPTVASNGTLYFYSMRDAPESFIYRSKCDNGNYVTVERVSIPAPYGAWDPFIAPDESYIIFTSIYPDGFGKEDQYISYNKSGRWTNPKNLGSKINSARVEYGSYVSPDSKYYFFSRVDAWGPNSPADIYWVSADFIDSLRKSNFVPYCVKGKISDQAATMGHAFSYAIPVDAFVDDDDNDTLTYSVEPLPLWLHFDPRTRTFSGTPKEAGRLNITVTVADTANAKASCSFVVTVGDRVSP